MFECCLWQASGWSACIRHGHKGGALGGYQRCSGLVTPGKQKWNGIGSLYQAQYQVAPVALTAIRVSSLPSALQASGDLVGPAHHDKRSFS